MWVHLEIGCIWPLALCVGFRVTGQEPNLLQVDSHRQILKGKVHSMYQALADAHVFCLANLNLSPGLETLSVTMRDL